jgi:hypothetical protein
MLFLSVMGSYWFQPSKTIFFDKYRRQFDDDNIGESSLSSNEDVVIEEMPRLENLPLRVNDIYVVDQNGNYHMKSGEQLTNVDHSTVSSFI